MRFPHFFIDHPIFASVLSLIILIVGAIAGLSLPIAEYPEIAPPTVNISATYPGASAQVIAETVATPIEQEVNGVDDMLYITSQSTGDGRLSINVVFKPGTDIDQAQVLVQNRVQVAEPRLPEQVRALGLVVRKASPDLMMVVHMISPDGTRDQQYISNYATLYVKDVIARVDGVGDVRIFGARDYSMRIWLDPDKLAGALAHGHRRGGGGESGQSAGGGGRYQPAAGEVAGSIPVDGEDARAADRHRAVREHRRARGAERLVHPHPRHRPRRARVAGLHRQRLPQQQDGDGARHLSAARLQRLGDGGCRQADHERSSPRISRRASPIRSSTTRPSSSSSRSTPSCTRCSRRWRSS